MNIADQLKPQYDSPLEWWYIHGNFTLPGGEEYYFVFSFFRNQFQNDDSKGEQGYQAIFSIIGADKLKTRRFTYIDQAFFNGILSYQAKVPTINIDLNMRIVSLLLSGAKKTSIPYVIKESSPIIDCCPISIKWEEISYCFDGRQIDFSMYDKNEGIDLKLTLELTKPLIDIFDREPEHMDRYRMAYLTQSRLPVSGNFNNTQIVAGQSWIDHQWGTHDYLFNQKNNKEVRGWNWLGINLEDKSDLLIWQHLNAETLETIDSQAFWIINDNVVRADDITIVSIKDWFSHETESYFPVGLRIIIPEFSADLIFTPLTDKQEIPVFGPMRSVWQGAGKISGSIKGRSITGTARLELSGHSYLFNVRDHFAKVSKRIESVLKDYFTSIPDKDNHSKHQRERAWGSIVAYYMLKALETDPQPFEQLIFVLAELMHTGKDPYFIHSQLIQNHPNLSGFQKHEILSLFKNYPANNDPGKSFKGLAELSAIISNSDAETRHACGLFGQKLGIAYQLIKDTIYFKESGQPGNESLETYREAAISMVDESWTAVSRHLPLSESTVLIRVLADHVLDETL